MLLLPAPTFGQGSYRHHLEQGETCYDLGSYDCAIAHADSVIQLDSAVETPLVLRGLARAAQALIGTSPPNGGMYLAEEGESFFQRELSPRATHELALAVHDFTDALTRDPRFAEAYYHRGYANAILGRLPQAVDDFGHAATIRAPTHWFAFPPQRLPPLAYNDRGLAHEELGAIDSALADFSHAIDLAPDYPLPLANRGRIRWHRNDAKQAADDFRQALSLTDDPALRRSLNTYLNRIKQ